MYLNGVPDDTTLIRWANLIQPKTLEKFNQGITHLAIELKVTCGRKLHTDGTVAESNIRAPSDSHLLANGVGVLARSVVCGLEILQAGGNKVQKEFEDFTQTSKRISHQIGEAMRNQKAAARLGGNNIGNCWQ